MTRERVCVVWAILRQRHPLLAATVEMHDYDDVRFVYVQVSIGPVIWLMPPKVPTCDFRT